MLYSPFATAEQEIFGKLTPPANVSNFTMVARIDLANLKWDRVADLDVINGGTYWVRHTNKTSNVTWAGSSDITKNVPGTLDTYSVPLLSGTYLIKALDSSGNESNTAAMVTSNVADILDLNVVYTSTQHPTFGNSTGNTGVDDSDTSNVSFDSTNNTIRLTDTSIGVGYYYFTDQAVDLGQVYTSRVTSSYSSTGFSVSDLFDSAEGLFDSALGMFDGTDISGTNAGLQIRTTPDDPAGTPNWSSWGPFFVGDYLARGLQFRMELVTDNASNNVQVDNLSTTVDMPDTLKRDINVQTDSGSNNGTKVVTYAVPFKTVPSVGITTIDADDKIYYVISSSTATGFTITFYDNNTSSATQKTFNWLSSGY
jgi:hypothetical protein